MKTDHSIEEGDMDFTEGVAQIPALTRFRFTPKVGVPKMA